MANTKISALPASTTPLAGTEVLPIVQSSTTKQVSVANLTAGRAVATGALTVTGAATVSSTLGVTGAATLSSTLGVTGAATLSSSLGVAGATTLFSVATTSGTIANSPSGSTDIANKAYVDTVAQGLDTKASVVAGTTANITLSGTQTVDGVVLIAGDRVLVKNQTTTANNGLYLCAAGSWTRTTDMDNWAEVPGAYVFVEGGTTLADTGWVCTSDAGGTIGVTAIVWAQFSGAGSGVSSINFGSTGLTPATTTTGAVTVAGTLAVLNGGTGITSFGTGIATFLGTPSSANLRSALTDETGTGSAVFATSPTLVTPLLGTPTSGVATNLTGLPLTTGVTGLLPVANGGTATATPSIVAGTNITVTGTWPNQTIASSGGSGTVTSVDVSGGTTGLTTSGGPVTSSGTVTLAGTLAVANGGTGQTSYTDGQLLIGNTTGNTLTKTTLTAGSGITITNGSGAITIASSGGASAATPTVEGTVYGKMTASGGTPFLTALGYNAGLNTTGVGNTAVGVDSLKTNTTGSENTAVGKEAMKANTTGINNCATGFSALTSNTTANNNSAFGTSALTGNTTGTSNSAFGFQALLSNTTGTHNTAAGHGAAYTNTTGTYATAMGYQALYSNTSGSQNTAMGLWALYSNTTADQNTGIGSQSLYSNTTGTANVGLGYQSLYSNTTASQNTAVGYQSLYTNSNGANNTAVGYQALKTSSTASDNTAVGFYALLNNTTGEPNSAFGKNALKSNTTGTNNTAIGQNALRDPTTASNNTAIGHRAGESLAGNGAENVLIGVNAGNYSTILDSGSQNVCIGTNVSTGSNNNNASITIGYQIQGQGTGYATFGSPSGKIYNQFTTNATWTQTSDVRLKTNIENDLLGLSFINRLRTVKFNWKPSNEIDQSLPQYSKTNIRNTETVIHGLIAQEVKAALDAEGVSTFAGWDVGLDGVQAISREMFISPLIKAIQEQQAIIETLKARLDAANL